MTLRQFTRTLFSALLLAVLATGCAGLPKEELQQADDAIAEARAAEAERFAPAEWSAATNTKNEAEQAVNNGEFSDARQKAIAATAAARAAVSAAEKNRAIFEENERQREEEEARRLAEEQAAAEAAAAADPFAFDEESGDDPFASEFEDFPEETEASAAGGEDAFASEFEEETISEPAPVAAAPEPEPEPYVPPAPPAPAPSSYSGESRPYQVKRYDTLAKIAQREYGDGDLWYIIYAANRDLIKDPDLLPRIEIMIPVSPSEAQKEEAREINRNHVPNLWDGM